jgi:DNA uptake protein ComE-like DNA-binding protein
VSEFINTNLYAEIENLKEENSSLRRRVSQLVMHLYFVEETQDARVVNLRKALSLVCLELEKTTRPEASQLALWDYIENAVRIAVSAIEEAPKPQN